MAGDNGEIGSTCGFERVYNIDKNALSCGIGKKKSQNTANH